MDSSGSSVRRLALGIFQLAVVVAYPVAVYLGLTRLSVRQVGLLLLVLLLPSMVMRLRGVKVRALASVAVVPLVVATVVGISTALDSQLLLLLLPALVNAALLVTFGGSLWTDQPMVERFARLIDPELSEEKCAYCRRVTFAWCLFFVANGATSLALALWAPLQWWALYTGLISYFLLGIGFALEYAIRKYRFRDFGDGLPDRLLARFFPPP